MAATTLLRTRVNRSRATEAKNILARLGLKPGDAVNLLFAQIVNRRGLPFAVQEEGYAYAEAEYGVSPAELDQTAESIRRESERARRRLEIKALPADWRDLRKGA